MEGGLDMATRKRLANRFRAEYARGTKKQKGEVLDRLVAVGMGRSTARRLLSQAVGSEERPGPGRGRRPKYGEEAQRLLERLWLLMGMPCGPYMKAMLDQWIPALRADGELDDVDGDALEQVCSMSASTIDRRLRPLKRAAMPRGMSLTRPAGEHLRNSVRIRKCADEIARLPGLAEADTVAHCGPRARGEFARTLTMVDYATNWTVSVTVRNNAKSNIRRAGRRRSSCAPWARVLEYDAASRADGGRGYVDDATRTRIENLIASTNPARLGREIAAIQDELERLSRERTEGMARRQGLDMGYLGKVIERMRADAEQDNK